MSQLGASASNHPRVLRLFIPDAKARNFLVAALLVPGLLFVCIFAVILTSGPSQSEMNNAEAIQLIAGFFLLPVAAVLMTIAALREPHHPPRAIMWLAATLFIFLAGGIV